MMTGQLTANVHPALALGDAMLQRFAPIVTRWRDEFKVITGIGIALHLGEVALGIFGPPGKKAVTKMPASQRRRRWFRGCELGFAS